MAEPNASIFAGSKHNESCIRLPIVTDSSGLMVNDYRFGSLAELLLQMIFIFFSIQIVQFLLRRFHLPKFCSELLAGLIFGRLSMVVFITETGARTIDMLAMFGFTLSLFLTGVRTDVKQATRTGRKAFAIGISGLVVPMMFTSFGSILLRTSYSSAIPEELGNQLAFVAGTQCLTTFPVITSTLTDLEIINSELGRLSLSSAIVSDLFSTALVSMGMLLMMLGQPNKSGGVRTVLANLGFILAVLLGLRPVMFWIVRQTPQGRAVKQEYVFGLFAAALVAASWTSYFQSYVLFGPYLVGLAVPAGPPLGSAIVDKLEPFVSNFLGPMFVFLCSQKVELVDLMRRPPKESWLNAGAIVSILVVKIVAGAVPGLCFKMPLRDALAAGLILTAKGAVDLAFYDMFRDIKDIDDSFYASLILTSAVASGLLPLLVKVLYDPSRKYVGYEKRTIMHLKVNSELRIVTCIHRPDNIAPVINLLTATSPTSDSPLTLHVLHLIELVGRASPLLISHKLQKKRIDSQSFNSEPVILAFTQFERQNRDSVNVNLFTAISPPKLMHADICTLALDKLASLIILPFHRKWSADGSIAWEDRSVRALNCSVLDMAPCSVAILVDHSPSNSRFQIVVPALQPYKVAVLFFGGNDDREALTYALRMVKHPNITLTMVRFTPYRNDGDDGSSGENGAGDGKEEMLDSLVLGEFNKQVEMGTPNAIYREEMVSDGQTTALAIRSMLKEYGLIVVGRNHKVSSPLTAGLSQWSEFPELGVVGDILASSDLKMTTSVFIVQQQRQQQQQ